MDDELTTGSTWQTRGLWLNQEEAGRKRGRREEPPRPAQVELVAQLRDLLPVRRDHTCEKDTTHGEQMSTQASQAQTARRAQAQASRYRVPQNDDNTGRRHSDARRR